VYTCVNVYTFIPVNVYLYIHTHTRIHLLGTDPSALACRVRLTRAAVFCPIDICIKSKCVCVYKYVCVHT